MLLPVRRLAPCALVALLTACGSLSGSEGDGTSAPGPSGRSSGVYAVVGSEPAPFVLADVGPVEVTFELNTEAPPGGLVFLPAADPAGAVTFPATQVRFDAGQRRSRLVVAVPAELAPSASREFTLYLVHLQHGESTLPGRVIDAAAASPELLRYHREHAASATDPGGIFGR